MFIFVELCECLICNFKDVLFECFECVFFYDMCLVCLVVGMVVVQFGVSVDIVVFGKISCFYYFYYEEEEMFIVLQGEGMLCVVGECLVLKVGDVVFIFVGLEYLYYIINIFDVLL